MIISALKSSTPIVELYGNKREKEDFIAPKHQLESYVVNQLSQLELFLIPVNCIFS